MCINASQIKRDLLADGSELSVRALEVIELYENIILKHQNRRRDERRASLPVIDVSPSP